MEKTTDKLELHQTTLRKLTESESGNNAPTDQSTTPFSGTVCSAIRRVKA